MHRRLHLRCFLWLFVAFALVLFTRGAFAEEDIAATEVSDESAASTDAAKPINSNDIGAITLQLSTHSNGVETNVEGGKLALYCVATISEDGMSLDVAGGQFPTSKNVQKIPGYTKKQLDAKNATISAALEKEATTSGIQPQQTAQISGGKASFPSVKVGLYLVTQLELSEGYKKMNAFLLSVPDENGSLNVEGKPKPGSPIATTGETKTPKKTATKKTATRKTTAVTSKSGSSVKLKVPKTGDAAVALLPIVAAGLLLMLLGLRGGDDRQRGEA